MIHPNGPRTGRPPTRASRGMVATPHHLASETGVATLRRGGSAVDAAIAANAVLCVVYPHMAGLGGDGFWLIGRASSEQNPTSVEALDASGPSARLATSDFYAELGVTDTLPMRGALAALTVPGAVDGWRLAHERHGKLPWRDLFEDAVTYAQTGVTVSRSLADWITADAELLAHDEGLARIYMPGGLPLREGASFTQPELAATLKALAEDGARAFYEGEAAERICAGLSPNGSPLTPDDFAPYTARWVDPISTTYRGHEVVQMPPPTQGFAALQIVNLIEGFDVSHFGDGTFDYYHHLVEATRVAFADRDEWLTDPSFVDIPLDELLAQSYANTRRDLIRPERALRQHEIEPGLPFGDDVDRRPPEGDTVYFCAADSDGMLVSSIQSIYHDFGAAVMAPGTGLIMQNRGSFFSLDPTHPNRLEPGKRTFHTIIPAMLTRHGEPIMAFGSMGGEGQPQTQAALLTRTIDFGYNVQQAIEAPRWLSGRTWGEASQDLWLEGRISDEVGRALELAGHPVKWTSDWHGTLGHAQAIRRDISTGFFEGGADPRGDGTAAGY